jgi:hypothetical protein
MSWLKENVPGVGSLSPGASVKVTLTFEDENPFGAFPFKDKGAQFLGARPNSPGGRITWDEESMTCLEVWQGWQYEARFTNTGDFSTWWSLEGGGFE